jgi:hypothetical protein
MNKLKFIMLWLLDLFVIYEWEEGIQQPATPNPAGMEPNDWESIFIVNLTLTSKHLFG